MNSGRQVDVGFNDTQDAWITFEFYVNNKESFNIKEIILVDEDALQTVTA